MAGAVRLLFIIIIAASLSVGYASGAKGFGDEVSVPPWEEAFQHIKPKVPTETQAEAVEALTGRLLPTRAHEFSFSVDPSIGPIGKDSFQVVSPGSNASVDITGTSGVAAAWGLLHYLKYKCNAHVSWEADQLSLPEALPEANIYITSNDRFRYYENVCTVSYSMAWWKWSRWEREIDWMALNGINMPLAFTAQEAIWQRVYTNLGLTQEELDDHFVGPAFFAWGRMGNIMGWGGPLSQSWHEQTLALQHQILDRMRSFGMTPVLPAFAGHVPAGLRRVFPEANITRLGGWAGFNCSYSCSYLLDPNDPLFQKIGSDFINEMSSEFGTDHLYNCDTFNEMTPHSSDPSYLSDVGASIFKAMTESDSKAIWVMQGWLFYNQEVFWRKPQAKALLTSVPVGRLLVLDLSSERAPQYSRLESYFGQPFIFCMLHDYGGVDGFFGNVDELLDRMVEARNYPNVTLVGTGLTPEGINQNYVMYDLMNELAWRTTMPHMANWSASYASRRYNSDDIRLQEAWALLMRSVYNCKVFLRYHGRNVVIMKRPKLKPPHLIWYSVDDVVKAWDLVIEVVRDSSGIEGNGFEEEDGKKETKTADQVWLKEDSRDGVLVGGASIKGKEESVDVEEKRVKLNHKLFEIGSKTPTSLEQKTSSLEGHSEQTRTMSKGGSSYGKTDMVVHSPTSNSAGNKELLKEVATLERETEIISPGEINPIPLASELMHQETFLHDVTDITRQILQILGGQLALRMIENYRNGDKFGVELDRISIRMLLKDLDSILATSPDFLLGSWLEDASSWATNEQERDLYAFNALNQVTLWGPNGEILDYALKQWSGLISQYVLPRWELFGEMLLQSLDSGLPFSRRTFQKRVFEKVEQPFSEDVNATFSSEPEGDTLSMALLLHAKYRPFFKKDFMMNLSQNEVLQDPSSDTPEPTNGTSSHGKKKKKSQEDLLREDSLKSKAQRKIKKALRKRQRGMSSKNSIWNISP